MFCLPRLGQHKQLLPNQQMVASEDRAAVACCSEGSAVVALGTWLHLGSIESFTLSPRYLVNS